MADIICEQSLPVTELQKAIFFVTPENLGIRIRKKEHITYKKMASKLLKSEISPKFFLFPPVDRYYMIFIWYVYTIYMVYINYRVCKLYLPGI